ncbi:hypothetical protein SLE2022_116610 [Rubroshorea leprosula]
MKLPRHLLLFILVAAATPTLSSAAACHPDDEASLLGFKSGTNRDPSGLLNSWKPGTDCCTWDGITCFINRVSTIWLQANQPNISLSGTISPALSKVRNLDGIYLINLINISGRFPELLFGLPNLEYVYIENNKLSGTLPQTIGKLKKLEALSFAGNRFTGPIPSSISALTGLTQLKLRQNFLTDTVRLELSNLRT